MSSAGILYRLQVLDLESEEKTRRLRTLEAQFGETQALRSAREALAAAEARLNNLRKTLRRQEIEAGDLEAKIKQEEEKLYGGRVRNPKELAGLEEAVKAMKRTLSAKEDEVLENLLEVETVENQVATLRIKSLEIESAWKEAQARMRAEYETLKTRLVDLRAARAELASQVPDRELSIYEELRRKKAGRAVATFSGLLCHGCGMTFPSSEAQRARQGEILAFCNNCGRILYAGN